MNIKKIISAATAALIAVASSAAAYAGPKNDGKKKLEEENKRLQSVAEELANSKQKTQISETYTKYLENLLDKSNNKSQLSTDELKKRADTTGRKNLKGDKWRRLR